MSLKAAVSKRIIETVFAPLHKEGQWKVLVLDHLSTKIVSSCMKMHDLIDCGITLVESLEKHREPIPQLEAIYIITPNPKSIQTIVNDFADSFFLQYKTAHIFFTEVCSDFLLVYFKEIRRYVTSLKEIDIAFVPLESQVFTLDYPWAFERFYRTSVKNTVRVEFMEKLAEQLATLCASLGEYPSVRYRQESSKLGEFTRLLKDKLDLYKLDDPTMGEGSQQKCKSQLLILDRGFDPTSPLLHELTYQAMAYDLLDIENDVFKYEGGSEGEGQLKEVLLDENDEMWVKLRHFHIADVTRTIADDIKNFSEKEKLPMTENKMKDLQVLLKKAPEYQQQVKKFLVHFSLAESCMEQYKDIADKLCNVEQDMATGEDKEGIQVKEAVRYITPLLLDPNVSKNNKIRIILLYILFKHGISEENLEKFCEHGNISIEEKTIILNMVHLGIPVTLETGRKKGRVSRKERAETFYITSRWVPYLKDLMEDTITGSLSNKLYPYLTKRAMNSSAPLPITSARRKNVSEPGNADPARDVPRLIVFIMGGVTYSETRAAYEVASANKDWEVIIGSDCVLTPSLFLHKLASLSDQ